MRDYELSIDIKINDIPELNGHNTLALCMRLFVAHNLNVLFHGKR